MDLIKIQRAQLIWKLKMNDMQYNRGSSDLSILTQLEELQFKYRTQSLSGGEKADMIKEMQLEWNSVSQKLLDACCERLRCDRCNQSPLDHVLANNHHLPAIAASELRGIKACLQVVDPTAVNRGILEKISKELWQGVEQGYIEKAEPSWKCGEVAWNGSLSSLGFNGNREEDEKTGNR